MTRDSQQLLHRSDIRGPSTTRRGYVTGCVFAAASRLVSGECPPSWLLDAMEDVYAENRSKLAPLVGTNELPLRLAELYQALDPSSPQLELFC